MHALLYIYQYTVKFAFHQKEFCNYLVVNYFAYFCLIAVHDSGDEVKQVCCS